MVVSPYDRSWLPLFGLFFLLCSLVSCCCLVMAKCLAWVSPLLASILSILVRFVSRFLFFPLTFGYHHFLLIRQSIHSFAICFRFCTSSCKCWTCSWRSLMVVAVFSGCFSLWISVSTYPATFFARFALSAGIQGHLAMLLVIRHFTVLSWLFMLPCFNY